MQHRQQTVVSSQLLQWHHPHSCRTAAGLPYNNVQHRAATVRLLDCRTITCSNAQLPYVQLPHNYQA